MSIAVYDAGQTSSNPVMWGRDEGAYEPDELFTSYRDIWLGAVMRRLTVMDDKIVREDSPSSVHERHSRGLLYAMTLENSGHVWIETTFKHLTYLCAYDRQGRWPQGVPAESTSPHDKDWVVARWEPTFFMGAAQNIESGSVAEEPRREERRTRGLRVSGASFSDAVHDSPRFSVKVKSTLSERKAHAKARKAADAKSRMPEE